MKKKRGRMWHISDGQKTKYNGWSVLCRSYLYHNSEYKHENIQNVVRKLCSRCVREAYKLELINIEWRIQSPTQVMLGILK